jgi:hypothetical protein
VGRYRSFASLGASLAIALAGPGSLQIAVAQPAPAPQTPGATLSAAPGLSGGEGGGFGRDVTLKPATKEEPFLQTTVGQPSGPPSGNDPASKCLRFAWSDMTDIPGAPTQITAVSVKDSMNGTRMCVVNGYVAPQVGFRILLPLTTWNGKYMQNGCGGQCADFIAIPCEVQVGRGYACLAADMGHKSTTYDQVWAIEDPLAQIDRAWRSTHVSAVAGKEITKRFYGEGPKHAYFHGASTGGGQALTLVQRFPMDFDGVISGEGGPPRFIPPTRTRKGGGRELIVDGKPVVTADDITMLHKAVLARCDANDGLKDGIITDPRACDFKPEQIQCKGKKDASCLTPAQVTAVAKAYGDGEGPQLGSELSWIGAFVARDGSTGRYSRPTPKVRPESTFVGGYGPPNPDLSAFKARGGKFIHYTGWADEIVDPVGAIEYYEKVERTMGGRAQTQDFYRFFAIPGQGHIPGNVGAESLDYIVALENWVEKGQAPDVLVGHKLKWITQMMGPMYLEKDLQPSNYLYSRPHYPWPIQARYDGVGDPDQASSFRPWDPRTKTFVDGK